jgi:signal peptidase II
MRRALPWLTVLAVLLLDRASKLAIMAKLSPGEWVPVCPGFSLSHVHNTGIAFSLFAGGGTLTRVLLHLVIGGAVVMITWMLVQDASSAPVLGVGLGLILGGALGNLVDRVLYGWVVDFLRCWVRIGGQEHVWPDFNVADSAISVGAVLLILHEVLGWRQRHPRGATEATDAPGSD